MHDIVDADLRRSGTLIEFNKKLAYHEMGLNGHTHSAVFDHQEKKTEEPT